MEFQSKLSSVRMGGNKSTKIPMKEKILQILTNSN